MKNLYLFLIGILLSGPMNAQQNLIHPKLRIPALDNRAFKAPDDKGLSSTQTKIVEDSLVIYTYSSSSDSTRSKKWHYLYDTRGLSTLSYSYTWNKSGWSVEEKYEIDLLDELNPTQFTFYSWDDQLNDFAPKQCYKFDYISGEDSSNTTTVLAWDDVNSLWINRLRQVHNFSNGRPVSSLYYKWDTGWFLNSKILYDHNKSESYDYSSTTYEYDIDADDFNATQTSHYRTNSNGAVTDIVHFKWNSNSLVWMNSSKEGYRYDGSDNLVNQTLFNWNGDAWIGVFNVDCGYDDNNHQISYLESRSWDKELQEWNGYSSKTLSFYDKTGFKTYHENYFWNASTGLWVLYNKVFDYYSSIDITTDLKTESSFKLHYSQHNKTVQVKLPDDKENSTLKVYAITGREVLSQQLKSGLNLIEMSSQASGLYIFKISKYNDSTTFKILLK